MKENKVTIIGAGLAGVEAAYQVASRGIPVEVLEMRPTVMTEAHTSGDFAEMVCSNSLGSGELTSASGLLKEELCLMDSFFLRIAARNRVPAGQSFSVDRLSLAAEITRELTALPGVTIERREVTELRSLLGAGHPVIIASGPLTSPALAAAVSEFTMRRNLFFFDATSPLIRAETIDREKVYAASRYEKGEADFLNIPLDEAQYTRFVQELLQAETVPIQDFEKNLFFEACLPIEEIARRGEKSLSFGPLKPVGLPDPRSGALPYAVVQLRQDDLKEQFYQIVGFQTRLKWPEQKRIFSMLPGLEQAEFERYGRMHRNTYINAPLIIDAQFRAKTMPHIFFAGQISGVEGYVESTASGLIAGLAAVCAVREQPLPPLPPATALGSLSHYIANANWKDFRPTKFTFGLLPDEGLSNRNKKIKKQRQAEIALEHLGQWKRNAGI